MMPIIHTRTLSLRVRVSLTYTRVHEPVDLAGPARVPSRDPDGPVS